jgi:HD-like signal output (HDOD) protein
MFSNGFAGFADNMTDTCWEAEMDDNKALHEWVTRLSQSALPVLKHTARDLAALRADEVRLNAHAISKVIASDPIMTVKLLRYLQSRPC